MQRTPIAITSLSGLKLEQQGITSVREPGNIAPNLFQSRVAVAAGLGPGIRRVALVPHHQLQRPPHGVADPWLADMTRIAP